MIKKKMIGQRLRIEWVREEYGDWPYFVVRDVRKKKGLVRLRGADYPAAEGGWTHYGDSFWVPLAWIAWVEVVA